MHLLATEPGVIADGSEAVTVLTSGSVARLGEKFTGVVKVSAFPAPALIAALA